MSELTFPHRVHEIQIRKDSYKLAMASNLDELYDNLLTGDSNHEDVKDERIPYWAEVWPSAIALSEFVAENENLVKNKNVIEIGCGLGLSGLVSARYAKHVTFTDYMQAPLDFVKYNCYLNNTSNFSTQLLDWRKPDKSFAADVLIAADVAYERRMFVHLIRAFRNLIKRNGLILISEPDRHYARTFFNTLEEKGFKKQSVVKKVELKSISYSINVHMLKDWGKM